MPGVLRHAKNGCGKQITLTCISGSKYVSLAKCMAMTLGSKEHCLGERMLGILRMFGESFAFATGNDGRDGLIAGIRRPDAS